MSEREPICALQISVGQVIAREHEHGTQASVERLWAGI